MDNINNNDINIIKKSSVWLKFYSLDKIFNPLNNFHYNGIRILSRSLFSDIEWYSFCCGETENAQMGRRVTSVYQTSANTIQKTR